MSVRSIRDGVARLVTSVPVAVVFDQGCSSATNFALGLQAARAYSDSELGVLAAALALYYTSLALSRGAFGDVFVIRASGASYAATGGLASRVVVAALGPHVLSVVPVAVIALVAPSGRLLLPMVAAWPLLLVQDLFRQVALGRRTVFGLYTIDLIWLIVQVTLIWRGFGPVGAWATGAVVAAGWGLLVLVGRDLRQWSSAPPWYRHNLSMSWRYAVEALVQSTSGQLILVLSLAVLGARVTGLYKVVDLLFGPVTTALQTATTVSLAEASRLRGDLKRQHRVLVRVQTGLSGLTIIYVAGLLALEPVGRVLVGDRRSTVSSALILLYGGKLLWNYAWLPPTVHMRSRGMAARTLTGYLRLLPIALSLPIVLGLFWETTGFLAGAVIAAAIATVYWHWTWNRVRIGLDLVSEEHNLAIGLQGS